MSKEQNKSSEVQKSWTIRHTQSIRLSRAVTNQETDPDFIYLRQQLAEIWQDRTCDRKH